MSASAGIGRDAAGLAAASDAIESATVGALPVDRAGVEDAALTLLGQAVLAAAGTRRETRGCHVRTDFPDRDDVWQRESLVVALDGDGRPVVGDGRRIDAAGDGRRIDAAGDGRRIDAVGGGVLVGVA
ncbi:hypothetical protein ACFQV8_21605 [Pseudonocardia benzenivorans]